MKRFIVTVLCTIGMFSSQMLLSMNNNSYAKSNLLVNFLKNEHIRLEDKNFLSTAIKLFEMGADINTQFSNQETKEKYTPLSFLLQTRPRQLQWDGGVKVIQWLIENKANVNVDLGERTPLSIACQYGCPLAIIKQLIEAGAEFDKRLSLKDTVLGVVLEHCDISIIQYFLDLYEKKENEMMMDTKLTLLNEK